MLLNDAVHCSPELCKIKYLKLNINIIAYGPGTVMVSGSEMQIEFEGAMILIRFASICRFVSGRMLRFK